MKVLAFDSSAGAFSAAVRAGDRGLPPPPFESLAPRHPPRPLPALRAAPAGGGAPGRAATPAAAEGPPDAAVIARLALARWRPGTLPPPPLPLYLRAPDAAMPGPRRAPW